MGGRRTFENMAPFTKCCQAFVPKTLEGLPEMSPGGRVSPAGRLGPPLANPHEGLAPIIDTTVRALGALSVTWAARGRRARGGSLLSLIHI